MNCWAGDYAVYSVFLRRWCALINHFFSVKTKFAILQGYANEVCEEIENMSRFLAILVSIYSFIYFSKFINIKWYGRTQIFIGGYFKVRTLAVSFGDNRNKKKRDSHMVLCAHFHRCRF